MFLAELTSWQKCREVISTSLTNLALVPIIKYFALYKFRKLK